MARYARCMDASILSIGTELATGQCVDTNAAWLSAELTTLGFEVVEHVTVGDDVDRIADVLGRLLDKSGVVIVTGGLGPTPDDLTREGIARAIGQPLVENSEAQEQVRAFFARIDRVLHPSNLRQAMAPRGCSILHNDNGTAPGLHCRCAEAQLFALPGVASEMKAMFRSAVAPKLAGLGSAGVCVRRRLNCFGMSEAKIGELLDEFMVRDRNPLVGTSASRGVIAIRIFARAQTASAAEALAQHDLDLFRDRLGSCVFGEEDETLESVVGRLLCDQGRTLSTAESCTGGLLAKRITDVPGSSGYFLRGFVTYADEAKVEEVAVPRELIATHGAVSEPVASALASGCRTVAGSDFALSTTGIAGPTGAAGPDKPVGLVYIGLADHTGVAVRRLALGDHLDREGIRNRACSAALDLLRLRLGRTDRG